LDKAISSFPEPVLPLNPPEKGWFKLVLWEVFFLKLGLPLEKLGGPIGE
jgi:hypothetical protein